MRPANTIYRLSEPRDIPMCKKIWEESSDQFGGVKKLSWPTIIAERNGRLLGFVSTQPTKKMLVVGPLITRKPCHSIVILRLVEAYEYILRKAGVSSYWFHVEKKNKQWLKLIYKLGLKENDETDTGYWFERKLI